LFCVLGVVLQTILDVYIYIYIPCVLHQNNCKTKIGSHDMKHVFLNNHCQECVRALHSIHVCLSFLHEVMIGKHYRKRVIIIWRKRN